MKKHWRAMVVALGLSGGALLFAGPLDPPAGPVSETHKALTEVEPRIAISAATTPGDGDSTFKITQPGSYYLTGNVTGASGKSGIEIAASGVTIDLNGFALLGVSGSLSGVKAATAVQSITIRNGTVSGWGIRGIDIAAAAVTGVRLESITCSSNSGDGIAAFSRCVVQNCVMNQNGGYGLLVNTEAVVEDCTANGNGIDGISVGAGAVISRCVCRSNIGNGIRCASNGFSSITECVSVENGVDGIRVNLGVYVASNSCAFNGTVTTGAGIRVTGGDCRIESNSSLSNDVGIQVDAPGNIVVKNTCSGNPNNWSVVAGNTILVVNAATAGAVSGNSGGTAPGSADPNANFTY
ncbi:MAG: right-handed parallel beta-helix repeat-containing protein [Phycisphaerales bacterium]|nr:right-handed parallel beta-helix repeat-containing protein [Phycisphaerales bacterium]